MKVKLLVALMGGMLICAGVCRAEDKPAADGKKQEIFNTVKQEMLKNLDERIQGLQKMKGCVTSATNKEDLQKCREAEKKDMTDMRSRNKDEKLKRLDAAEKKLEEKKQQLQEQKKQLQSQDNKKSAS